MVRIALIEPNRADAYWFDLALKEAQVAVEVVPYRTGVSALDEWAKVECSIFDLIVVADVLPMLTLREFISRARIRQPAAHIVIAGDRESRPALQMEAVDCYAKPLSASDVEEMTRKAGRRKPAGISLFAARRPECKPSLAHA